MYNLYMNTNFISKNKVILLIILIILCTVFSNNRYEFIDNPSEFLDNQGEDAQDVDKLIKYYNELKLKFNTAIANLQKKLIEKSDSKYGKKEVYKI